jgi:hypothetical protein
MTNEELVLDEIRKAINARPDAEYIYSRAKELLDALERFGEPGILAFALVGAELAVKA